MSRGLTAWLLPASAIALAAGILIGRAADTLLPLLLMLPCAVAACFLLREKARFTAIQAAVLALGCLLGYAAFHPSLPPEGDYTVSGVVAESIRLREDGQVRTVLRSVTLDGAPLHSGAYWSFYLREDEPLPADLVPGCKVTMTARVYHPGNEDNPGGYNFREYLLQKNVILGIFGRDELTIAEGFHPMGLAASLRHRLTDALVSVMGPEAGSYAATMLFSAQDLIPEEDREAFNRLGIAHILSVSGFHVGVLAACLTRFLTWLRTPRKLRFGLILTTLAAYCFLTGLTAPVIRATLLWMLYELGALKHRQRSSLHLLAASFLVQLLISPAQIVSLSFHLSYAAMLGLTLVAPWLQSLYKPKRLPKLWLMFCNALGAQIGILLPELYWFQELPLLGVVLNTLVMGGATALISLCWLTFALLPIGPLAALLGKATALMMSAILALIRLLGNLDGMTLWVVRAGLLTAVAWVLLMLAMSWWHPRKGRWVSLPLAIILLAVSVFPWPNTRTRYVQLSVGEADSAVLLDGPAAYAIDTGDDGQALASYLHQRRISLDGLILTHLHTDHAGGIARLMAEGIPIGVCYIPYGALDAQVDDAVLDQLNALAAAGTPIVEWSRGETLPLPNGSVTVLWPEFGRVRPNQEANESSLALLADVKGTTLLLTGDLSGSYEHYAAEPADILKVAHHGSMDSTSPAFLQAVQPKLLLLSCGNDARIASMETRRGDIPMLDTDHHGALTIDFDNEGFTVTPMR